MFKDRRQDIPTKICYFLEVGAIVVSNFNSTRVFLININKYQILLKLFSNDDSNCNAVLWSVLTRLPFLEFTINFWFHKIIKW